MNSLISVHSGPAVTRTIAKTAANKPANTKSEAFPRFQPRRTSAPTTGSSPSARMPATKIDSSVPSETTASATRRPKAASSPSVLAGMAISTRCGGRSIVRDAIPRRGRFLHPLRVNYSRLPAAASA